PSDTAGTPSGDRARADNTKKKEAPRKDAQGSRDAQNTGKADSKDRKPKRDASRDQGKTDRGKKDQAGGDKPRKDGPAKDKGKKVGGGGKGVPDTEPQVVARHVPPAQGQPRTILVRRGKDETEWQRLERGERNKRNKLDISTGDTLVSLPGYRSAVELNN